MTLTNGCKPMFAPKILLYENTVAAQIKTDLSET